MPSAFVASRHQQAEVRAHPVRDEDLPAVDDPSVAVSPGGRLDVGDVAARVRLADPETDDLLAPDGRGEVALLLLLGAELQDGGCGHLALDGHAHADPARTAPGQLLGHDDRVPPVAALSAVLGRE